MTLSTHRNVVQSARAVGRRLSEALAVALSIASMLLAGVVLAGPAAAATPQLYAAVCPQAPPGTQAFADDVTSWVKWGVIVVIGLGALISIGAIAAGRMFNHPHASRQGAVGISVSIAAAIAYGVILVIIDSIVGSGCT